MSNNKRYFWMKMYEDFFSSKRIKRLRKLAGGDTYTIIYLKMQLKALKTNGYLYFDGVMEDFAEELALDIDESEEDVKVTIQYLLSVGLIECSESGEEWFLTYMQNVIGSETASTQRSRECRERKKQAEALQCNTDATTEQLSCNNMQQVGNAEKEKDIDIDKDKEKKIKEKKKKSDPISKEEQENLLHLRISHQPVLDAMHEWINYKFERGDSYTPTGFSSLLTQVEKQINLHGEEMVSDDIINSISREWQGIAWSDKPFKKAGSNQSKTQSMTEEQMEAWLNE